MPQAPMSIPVSSERQQVWARVLLERRSKLEEEEEEEEEEETRARARKGGYPSNACTCT